MGCPSGPSSCFYWSASSTNPGFLFCFFGSGLGCPSLLCISCCCHLPVTAQTTTSCLRALTQAEVHPICSSWRSGAFPSFPLCVHLASEEREQLPSSGVSSPGNFPLQSPLHWALSVAGPVTLLTLGRFHCTLKTHLLGPADLSSLSQTTQVVLIKWPCGSSLPSSFSHNCLSPHSPWDPSHWQDVNSFHRCLYNYLRSQYY